MRYRFFVALLCGVAFASLSVLLLNIWPIALPLSMFLLPGAIPVAYLSGSQGLGPPLAVLAANALVYSGIAYAILFAYCRNSKATTMRLAAIRLTAPAVIFLGLTCIPAFNPLWPQGMVELTKHEKELQDLLPLGTGLDQVRAVLRAKGIEFHEETEKAAEVVLNNGQGVILTAAPGDRTISSRLETDASQFPCGYDIEIVLLFGPDQKLKQQYIHRWRLCP
ncbi:MAG TPA: hypothetical protein VFA71_08570 [Terriglobales bacterium]|nr:hypothetical protein [Terriglobales bacterium]